MKETLELRNKPELKIILNKDEFEVVDISESKNSGIYAFTDLKNVELNAEKTNWLFSAFTLIVDLFTGSAFSKKFKSKAHMDVEMANRSLKIWLMDADFEKAKIVTELLNGKKAYTQQNL